MKPHGENWSNAITIDSDPESDGSDASGNPLPVPPVKQPSKAPVNLRGGMGNAISSSKQSATPALKPSPRASPIVPPAPPTSRRRDEPSTTAGASMPSYTTTNNNGRPSSGLGSRQKSATPANVIPYPPPDTSLFTNPEWAFQRPTKTATVHPYPPPVPTTDREWRRDYVPVHSGEHGQPQAGKRRKLSAAGSRPGHASPNLSRSPSTTPSALNVGAADVAFGLHRAESSHGASASLPSNSNSVSARDQDNTENGKRALNWWTDEETEDLRRGIKKHGAGNWVAIVHDPEFCFNNRTNKDLKDRYRVLLRAPRTEKTKPPLADHLANRTQRTEKTKPPPAEQIEKTKPPPAERVEQTKPPPADRIRNFTSGDKPTRNFLNEGLRSNTPRTGGFVDESSQGAKPVFIGRASDGAPRYTKSGLILNTAAIESGLPLDAFAPPVHAEREFSSFASEGPDENICTDRTDVWSMHEHDDSGPTTDTDSILQAYQARRTPTKKALVNEAPSRTEGQGHASSSKQPVSRPSIDDMDEDSDPATDADSILQAYKARKTPVEKTVTSEEPPRANGAEHTSVLRSAHAGVIDSDESSEDILSSSPVQQRTVVPPTPAVPVSHASTGSQPSSTTSLQPTSSALISQTTDSPKHRRAFTTEEKHLLIYLKEIKYLDWKEICENFPGRTKGTLQTHYCVKLGRRNKRDDPPSLLLPPKYMDEARNVYHMNPRTAVGASPLRVSEQHSQNGSQTPTSQDPRGRGRPRRDETVFVAHNVPQPGRGPGRPRREETVAASTETLPPRGPGRPRHEEQVSGADLTSHRGRPRRNVEAVNYTIKGLRSRRSDALMEDWEQEEDDGPAPDFREFSTPMNTYSPEPEEIIPPMQPMVLDPGHDDAMVVTSGQKLPYLSYEQRIVVGRCIQNGEWDQVGSRAWQGSIFHVDFSPHELDIVEDAMERVLGGVKESNSRRKRFRKTLQNQPEPKILRLSYVVQRRLSRDRRSVDAFMQDARAGKFYTKPSIQRLAAARPDRAFSSARTPSTSAMVLQRELGLQSRRGWKSASTSLPYQMRNKMHDTLGPVYSYTGASSDVHTLAWSPDGQYFAAGAICVTDGDSMQYNKPNNLLYGDLYNKHIHELGEHRTRRQKTDAGPNSTHEMFVSQDEYIYHTVSSVAFSLDGEYIFSAGYDEHVGIWRTCLDGKRLAQPQLGTSLTHRGKVIGMNVGRNGLLATATGRWDKPIKVVGIGEPDSVDGRFLKSKKDFASPRAKEEPDLKIEPTSLKFEPTEGRLLLVGFGANKAQDRLDTKGDICLFDVETDAHLEVHGASRNVFDLAWTPNSYHTFAVGCVASGTVNRGTRSTVRVYDTRGGGGKHTCFIEAECPALDMNDVSFCPYEDNLVAAGCTSGRTYIWDLRNPHNYLYELKHGKSLMPLDIDQDREVTDTGIQFLSWGNNATRLYTGSSDGIVKVWDVTRSPADAFVKDLITVDSGIMSGAFSHDFTKLVVGEVNGSINVLEVGNDDLTLKDMEKLKYLPYVDPQESDFSSQDSDFRVFNATEPKPEISAAAQLLQTGEMITVPFGGFPVRQAVQGPNYNGPYDDRSVDAPALRQQALGFQLSLASSATCDIKACKDVPKITDEEEGDSGRSQDRIPDELRKQFLLLDDQKPRPGKTKCGECGRPARPSPSTSSGSDVSGAAKALCERCSFSCFRCGGACVVRSRFLPEYTGIATSVDEVFCVNCAGVWDVGALGYECVEQPKWQGMMGGLLDVPSLTADGVVGGWTEGEVVFGDEVNALSEWYYGLGVCG